MPARYSGLFLKTEALSKVCWTDAKNRPMLPLLLGSCAMSDYLPKEVRAGLELARKKSLRDKSRLRVRVGDETFTILRYWENGFALDREDAPHLRGLVDVFDGSRHLSQCLIVASEEDSGEMTYEFKRATPAIDRAPLDYDRDVNAPVALIAQE